MAISIFDQADFVLTSWLLLLPLWTMSVPQAAICFVVVAAISMGVNVVGYAIGARSAPV